MITVSLPDPAGLEGIGPLPEGLRALVWDGSGTPPEGAEAIEFFVGPYMSSPPPAGALDVLPRLRVVQLLSAGVERWVPLVPDGVTLCNGRGVHGGATAELAVGGVIALLRRFPFFLTEQAAGRWTPERSEDLDGKRLLVLGAGDIGRRVSAALAVFGASPTFVGRTAREGVHGVDELAALLPGADVVVVAMPLTGETAGLLDAAALAALPDGAVIANVARGPIVVTDALVAELRSGRLRAFLDVTDPEPLPAGHPLWDAPNLILTPHVGGGTRGWQRRGYRLVRSQLERFAAGEPLDNVVRAGH